MLNFPGLTFKRGENIAALRTTVQHFAATEIAPRAADIDRNDQFPMDLWKKMGSLGLLGFTGDEAHGGIDMGYLAHIVAMENFTCLGICWLIVRRAYRRTGFSGLRSAGRKRIGWRWTGRQCADVGSRL